MKNFMPEKHVKISFSSKLLPIIEADPDRIAQVLRNLLNNAIKFNKDNGRVSVSAEREGDFIKISVEDTGIGISGDSLERLFEPFFQAEQTIFRKYQGTGLGLTISRGIIESQGGRIWVESALKKGSTFHFTIPLVPVKEVKSVRLLFSSTYKTSNKLKELFKEYLGPIGEHDFEELEEKNLIKSKELLQHIDYLVEEKVLPSEKAFEFKFRILSAIEGRVPSSIAANIESLSLKGKINLDLLKSLSIKFLGLSGASFFEKIRHMTYNKAAEQVDILTKKEQITLSRAKEFKDEMLVLFVGELAKKGGVEESFVGALE
jgi:hypothetical protein